jgi:hypothetical protein
MAMIKGRMFGLALMAMALVPGVALATHFNEVSVMADCEGWTATVNVTWRTGIYGGDLDFVIRLLDGDTVLEEYSWAGPLTRALDDPAIMTYTFQGNWAGQFPGPTFGISGAFHLVAPWEQGIDDVTASYNGEFACTVASETSTWSTIKTLYR